MAVVIQMDFLGGTQEQYDTVMRDLEGIGVAPTMPPGGLVHIAGETNHGWRIIEVWESKEAFDSFMAEGLLAALESAALPPPDIQTFTASVVLQRGDMEAAD